MTTIAILGLGEAGRRYARGLAHAGADVRAFDPAHELGDPDVPQFATLADTLAGADVALSLVTAGANGSGAVTIHRSGSLVAVTCAGMVACPSTETATTGGCPPDAVPYTSK